MIEIVEKYTGLDVNGDGLDGNSKIPAIDESQEEIHLVISTLEGGHNVSLPLSLSPIANTPPHIQKHIICNMYIIYYMIYMYTYRW